MLKLQRRHLLPNPIGARVAQEMNVRVQVVKAVETVRVISSIEFGKPKAVGAEALNVGVDGNRVAVVEALNVGGGREQGGRGRGR